MESEQSLVCHQLAEHLVEKILTWVPVESLCRFRSVSQRWNALISSAKFITTQWAETPPNRMPWLLVHSDKLVVAYCFYTGAWKKTSAISLSFLKENVYRDDDRVVNFCVSAVGLVLVTTLAINDLTIDPTTGFTISHPLTILLTNYLTINQTCFTVCNPLTRTFIELPPMTSIRAIRARGIVGGEGDHPETYKVVAMGVDRYHHGVVEIYDSTKKSWGIAPHGPPLLVVLLIARGEFVFCSGFFYCLGLCPNGIWEIMGFSMTDGISFSKQLTDGIVDDFQDLPCLVVCGSQLLVVGAIVQEGKLQKVIIWEFEKVNVNSSSSSSQWELKLKESVTMPSSLCEGVNRFPMKQPYPTMTCRGVKDCVCLIFNRDEGALEMVTYNIREKTWTELPSCPLDFESGYYINVFEPRPDMKAQ